jgi:hypothetical protein
MREPDRFLAKVTIAGLASTSLSRCIRCAIRTNERHVNPQAGMDETREELIALADLLGQ